MGNDRRKVGVVELGQMGGAMARRLLEQKFDLAVFDRNATAPIGGRPEQAAQGQLVFMVGAGRGEFRAAGGAGRARSGGNV